MTTRVYEIEQLHMAVAEAPLTNRQPANLQAAKRGLLRAAGDGLIRLSDTIQLWIARSRDRQFLGECSDHMLKDMGLSRCDADYEAGKGFWRG